MPNPWESVVILDPHHAYITGACFTGASVTKTATLLGVSRAAVSKVMTAYTNHGKTSSARRNSGQKPKLSERDHHTLKRIVSKKSQNYCSKGDSRTQYSNWRAFSQKVWRELHKSTFVEELQLLKLWLLETMPKGEKYGATIIKPGCLMITNT